MKQRWRDKAAPVVAQVVRELGVKDPVALRKALRDAYPFEGRSGSAYNAWLKEIDVQIGGMRIKKPDPAQADLFAVLQPDSSV